MKSQPCTPVHAVRLHQSSLDHGTHRIAKPLARRVGACASAPSSAQDRRADWDLLLDAVKARLRAAAGAAAAPVQPGEGRARADRLVVEVLECVQALEQLQRMQERGEEGSRGHGPQRRRARQRP